MDRFIQHSGAAHCADPGTPSSASRSGTLNHGDVVTYVCDSGYALIGANQITCEDGEFSNPAPTCAGKYDIGHNVIWVISCQRFPYYKCHHGKCIQMSIQT